MDPTKAADALGSGTAQVILAVMLVFVVLVAIWLGKALHGCLSAQIEGGKKDMEAQIVSNGKVADAIKEIRNSVDVMVRAVERMIDGRGKPS